MKLTITEYAGLFGIYNREAVAAKCRNGELNASKDDKGKWIIDVQVPNSVYEANVKARKKREYANALYHEYIKTEKEIEKLMNIVIDFRTQQ